MGEVANFAYVAAPLIWALLMGLGGLVLAVSSRHLKLARFWFFISVLPALAVPIAFGASSSLPEWLALCIAGFTGFIIGVIYSAGISFMNAKIDEAEDE